MTFGFCRRFSFKLVFNGGTCDYSSYVFSSFLITWLIRFYPVPLLILERMNAKFFSLLILSLLTMFIRLYFHSILFYMNISPTLKSLPVEFEGSHRRASNLKS